MKRLHLLTTLLAALLLASCGTSARLARAGAPQREQLSRQLGIPIGKRDNIALYAEAASWLGTPYRYGGTTRNGIDCSALVGNIYRSVYRRTLSRSAQDIARNDCRRIGKGSLKPGDLLFFNTSARRRRGINHVGIYLKANRFLHASTSRGVIISDLRDDYYRRAWKHGGRPR